MKKLFLVVSFLMIITNLHAQKMHLSGTYNDGFLQYLNNGKYQEIPLNLNDFTYDDNSEIVVYGEFQKDEDGNSYFNIMREHQMVQLISGTYLKKKYKCPATPDEGQITLANNTKITFSSFVPLNAEGKLSATKAEWGVKVCDNIIYSMYYIREINKNSTAQQTQNPINPANPGNNGANANPFPSGNIGSLVTAADAKAALDFHNKARNDVGVAPLLWSAEISSYAQLWANHLANERNCQLEHRSSAENPKQYGENIALGYAGYNALSASKGWYSEISQFQNVVLNDSNWYAAGHYSQMVWRKTTHVGIGIAKCTNGASIIVANYNPPGNFMGQKAY